MDRVRFFLPTEILASHGCVRANAATWILGRKALIVTGAKSAQLSGAFNDVVEALEAHHVPYVLFDGVRANPDCEQIFAAAAVADGADFVVAIGGGSPLDAAKSVAWVLGSKIPKADFFLRKPRLDDAVLPLVAIPLTCGTGSEVTPYSIITDDDAQSKVNISSPSFFPKVALIDANYLETLPPQVVCDSALDALSHAIEGMYSPRATRLTRALAEEAIAVIVPELVLMAHGMFVNLASLQYAAMTAGIVIAQTGTGLVHAMGYPLTYHKGIPHGRANGILLAGYLDLMSRTCASLTRRILKAAQLNAADELQTLVDTLLDRLECERIAPDEEELIRFVNEPLRLEVVRRYCTMPSPEEVMDIYRTGF
ncbi:MAG: iron-containing alcohol dehydrogenase [Kiritimatiellia bacterium]